MKTAFTKGAKVRFNLYDGAAAEIVRYDAECFYIVLVTSGLQKGRYLVAHEDDLVLEKEFIGP